MDLMEKKSATTLNAALNANIHVVGKSIIGTRDYQQDAFYTCFNGDSCLVVVCDGMGGSEHGELASSISVKTLVEDYEKMPADADPFQFLRREAIKLDEVVSDLTDEHGKQLDSGTTIVAAIVRNQKIWWLSVGDSRIYFIRKHQFQAVTREHNYKFRLDQLLRDQEISQEEYQQELAQGNALISYIGMNGIELIDQNNKPFEMQHMDRFLLCSDGLIRALGEHRVREILLKHPLDIEETLEEMIQSVENCGKKHIDNTTVVIISYE